MGNTVSDQQEPAATSTRRPAGDPAAGPITDSRILDHSESEVRLHRALYILKYLRALVLGVAAVSVAATLSLSGLRGLWDVVDSQLRFFKLTAASWDRADLLAFLIGLYAVCIGMAVYLYLSVVNVWRRSLKAWSVFAVCAAATYIPFGAWRPLRFSLSNLPVTFSILLIGFDLFAVLTVLHAAWALWGVSRASDTSSCLATLDRRLVSSRWSYLNKLLDLPRAPLKSLRGLASYLLAFGAAVFLIACMTNLLSGCAIANKALLLARVCAPANMPTCRARAMTWSWQVPMWLLLSVAGLKLAAFGQSLAKKVEKRSVQDALAGYQGRFVLYLRPFQVDHVRLPKPRLPLFSGLVTLRAFPAYLEEELFDVASGYRPLIAVSAPRDVATVGGDRAYREPVKDGDWKDLVDDRLDAADAVVSVISDTPGIRWELSRLVSRGHHRKTLFLFDPAAQDPEKWRRLASAVLEPLRANSTVSPGFQFKGQPLGFYFSKNEIVEIHNSHWTTTSYRTAFSQFLTREAPPARPPLSPVGFLILFALLIPGISVLSKGLHVIWPSRSIDNRDSRGGTAQAPAKTVVRLRSYRSPDGTFSLRYPIDWKTESVERPVIFRARGGVLSVSLSLDELPPASTIEMFVRDSMQSVASDESLATLHLAKTPEVNTAAGVQSAKLVYVNVADPRRFGYFVLSVRGSKGYVFTFVGPEKMFGRFRPVFDAIAGSLEVP